MDSLHRSAYRSLYSFFRIVRRKKATAPQPPKRRGNEISIAFIHNERKLFTGAHQINDLMASGLRSVGVRVKNFYPRTELVDAPQHLKGIANILFFYSLLERRNEILRYDLVQGTTYTPLPFLAFDIPVVAHFGSTTAGFLESTPQAKDLSEETRPTWYALRKEGIIAELNSATRRPLRDIADMECYVATQAAAVIATSAQVRRELVRCGVDEQRIFSIPNAIEDYWFTASARDARPPGIVFLGRLGTDAFTLKLKGLDRLVELFESFPEVPKTTIAITMNRKLTAYFKRLPNHEQFINLRKDFIPGALAARRGSVVFLPSRYEGFSLSLVEAMSQGLVPVAYPVGIAPEIIKDGINGYLVSSQKEAKERIRRILRDEALRSALSREAARTAEQFAPSAIIPRLVEAYRAIRLLPSTRHGSSEEPGAYPV